MASTRPNFSGAGNTGGLDRAELLDIYKGILDEYRFQLEFNWKRLSYCLTISLGLTPVAFGLLQIRDGWVLSLAAVVTFGGAIAVAVLGIRVTEKGREYYQRIRSTKADIEAALKLRDVEFEGARLNLAIESTEGMRERGSGIEPWKLIRSSSITYRFVQVFWLIAIVNTAGGITVIYMTF